jgi:hypothetical protein
MMQVRSVVRDVALVCLAVAIGWWLRGAGMPVMAQRTGSTSSGGDAGLAFQINGSGPDASLTIYNSGNHTLYVYQRIGVGSSYVNCDHSFRIKSPGAPLQRENCPIGELLPKD